MKLHRIDGTLIVELDVETIKQIVEYCVKENISLRNANLRNADLRNAKSIFIFNKIDGRTCYAVVGENGVMVKAGCFWGDISKFEAACKDKYPNDSIKAYAAQIQYLKAIENQIKQSK